MTTKCGARTEDDSSVYFCSRLAGHPGNHQHIGGDDVVYNAWPQEPLTYAYLSRRGHGKVAYQQWFDDEWSKVLDNPIETKHSVLLTLEELKGLGYALSGPEWLEDEPELVAKIDKALKAAL